VVRGQVLKMTPYKLNIKRGLIAGLVAGTVAFAGPWLLLYLLLFSKQLGNEVDPSTGGAWLGSYFLTSIVGTAAGVAFGTSPRSSVWRTFLSVALVAMVILALAGIVDGPRFKSKPPFGEKPIDLVVLTVPAVAAGLLILAWRVLRVPPSRSAPVEGPVRKQP
jgi:hypothetical protein